MDLEQLEMEQLHMRIDLVRIKKLGPLVHRYLVTDLGYLFLYVNTL